MKAKMCVPLVLLVLLVILTGCQPVPNVEAPAMSSTAKAMKGYELYSWKAEGEWHFALLMGTNRLKTIDEITAPGAAIESVAELRSRLAQLAQGEEIVWMTWMDDRLALPPQSQVEAVKQACQELGLELTIATQ